MSSRPSAGPGAKKQFSTRRLAASRKGNKTCAERQQRKNESGAEIAEKNVGMWRRGRIAHRNSIERDESASGECAKVWRTEQVVSATETPPSIVRITGSTFSLRVIAAAIILLFLYYAQGVVVTVLLSILLAYFLDPAVEFLERVRVPRTIGATAMVLVLLAVVGGAGYGLWSRAADFAASWPKYAETLHQAAASVETKIAGGIEQIAPRPSDGRSAEPTVESSILRNLILRVVGSSSLYAFFLEITIVPILVIAASALFFWIAGLDYPGLLGIASGLLNMVPYIGAVLAWLPPFVIALAKWKMLGSYVLVAGVLTAIHVLALNLVAPKLVGRRVRLNAVSITVALLFWGWVWGGMGLLLAIPLTASLRVVCDHTESWRPVGRWLSA